MAPTENAPQALVPVQFLTGVPPYNGGEIAGFAPDVAAHYVSKGWALYWDREKGQAVEPTAPPAAGDEDGEPKAPPAPPVEEKLQEAPKAPAPAAETSTEGAPAPEVTPDPALQEFNSADAIELIADEKDVVKLRALRAGEVLHPKYEGGRSTVLEAIDERIAELTASPAAGDGASAG